MKLSRNHIALILMKVFLLAQMTACTHNEIKVEESLDLSAEQAADAEKDEFETAAAAAEGSDTTPEKAAEEASSNDFSDPSQVQLNEQTEPSSGYPDLSQTSSNFEESGEEAGSMIATAPDLLGGEEQTAKKSLTVYFGKNSSKIKRASRREIKEISQQLKADRSQKIIVSGHSDSRGSSKLNKRLAWKRAKAVKAYMVKNGVSSKQIEVFSYGKNKLAVTASTESEHARNRRVEILSH